MGIGKWSIVLFAGRELRCQLPCHDLRGLDSPGVCFQLPAAKFRITIKIKPQEEASTEISIAQEVGVYQFDLRGYVPQGGFDRLLAIHKRLDFMLLDSGVH